MFPTAPYPKTVFPKFWDFGDSDPKEYCLGKKLAQTVLWQSFWDRLAQK
jgi:hypothetical protein